MLDWVEAGLPELDVPDDDRAMLIETMQEAVRQGSVGFVDDYLSVVHDWGISLEDVHAPIRVMVAREDTSAPPGHGEWLVEQLPNAELILVDGGHLGPRHEPEMQLMTWVGQGS
jgi:pimeloyl-ACP methyl ester carboxylesterase